MKTTDPNLYHIVIGFLCATVVSVVLSQLLSQCTLVETQKIEEVNTFVSSSHQFDNATRDYMVAVINQRSDQDKHKDTLIGNIQKQYGDLQVAKLYLGRNGASAADQYRASLLKLTNDLREERTVPQTQGFLEELNRTLQLRKVVETSLRKSVGLPTEPEAQA